MFSGIAAGIVRDSTPALFALASGIQWFALGSSYWRTLHQTLLCVRPDADFLNVQSQGQWL